MIRLLIAAAAAAAALSSTSARAEVKSASPAHFEIESKALVAATPAEAYEMLGRIDQWWSADHTYSGKAANLTLDLKAGGCFCERIPEDGGTIEHLRIVYARPGTALRGTGGLGPLQSEAVAATLSWSLKPAAGGTEITQSYAVAGRAGTGLDKLAPLVDRVMSEQLEGLRRRLSR